MRAPVPPSASSAFGALGNGARVVWASYRAAAAPTMRRTCRTPRAPIYFGLLVISASPPSTRLPHWLLMLGPREKDSRAQHGKPA